MQKQIHQFRTACHQFDSMIAWLELVAIVILVLVLIIAEILAAGLRELVNLNFSWIEEILKYAVIWVGLLGASLATRSREHISIEIVSRFVTPGMKRWLDLFIACISMVITLYLVNASIQYVQDERLSYLASAGTSRYIAIENLQVYHCPEAILQKRRDFVKSQTRALAYLQQLASAIAQEQPTPKLSQAQEKLQAELAEMQQNHWPEEWIKSQWQTKWQTQWQKAWDEHGEALWQKQGTQAISQKTHIDWMNLWLQEHWSTKGKSLEQEAWDKEGTLQWQEIAETSDLTESEFRRDWQNRWAERMFQEQWQAELRHAWENGGAKECWKQNFQKQWISQQWQKTWRAEWELSRDEHLAPSWTPCVCKICGQEKIAEPWKLPRWPLLLIIPIALAIISWRFGLVMLDSICGS